MNFGEFHVGLSELIIFGGMLACAAAGYFKADFNTGFGIAGLCSIMETVSIFVDGVRSDPPVYLHVFTVALLAGTFLVLFTLCWWLARLLPRAPDSNSSPPRRRDLDLK